MMLPYCVAVFGTDRNGRPRTTYSDQIGELEKGQIRSPEPLCLHEECIRMKEAKERSLIGSSHGVSTKMDFGEDTSAITNTTKVEDDDLEVKHTIVVSTKLKNNRRGIHGSNDDQRTLIYNTGQRQNIEKQDSGEVPIVNGYKAVETTQIRTPDTRHKTAYPDVTFESRNLRDEYDIYPNLANHPMQWKPSSFYNNINTWNQDYAPHGRSNRPYYQSKLNRRIADDTVKEFYCRRCMELGGQEFKGCTQRTYRTTTPKVKIDGKLVKLD